LRLIESLKESMSACDIVEGRNASISGLR